MNSEADEVLQVFYNKLDEAIEMLSELVVEQPIGFSSFNDMFKAKLRKTFSKLLQIRSKFGK